MIAKCLILFATIFAMNTSFSASIPADGTVDIWPSIPFVRGADLCRYRDTYSQTRTQYMAQMVRWATQFSYGGVEALIAFNDLYDKNLDIASQNNYLDVTLESTFKAYLDSYYRNLRPRVKKISFTTAADILNVIRAAAAGRAPTVDSATLAKLDFMAYGTYTLAPNCQGDIQITLHLVGKKGETESFVAQGRPEVVMSQIASQIFTQFQRTQFPSSIKVGNSILTLVGGLNSSVDKTISSLVAEQSCETLESRLPNQVELEILNSYGDWSGGVTLGDKVWAMSNGKVYAPLLRNPTPVRDERDVNADELFYYCVK